MKKSIKSILGVTLLEIMLVLAIAAMVIVMSIRYYQSASSSQQSNAILQQVLAIAAAADSLAQASGSYIAIGSASAALNNSLLAPIISTSALTAPWGGAITVTGTAAGVYTILIASVPSAVCPLLTAKLTANNHYTISPACSATGSTAVTVTYTASP